MHFISLISCFISISYGLNWQITVPNYIFCGNTAKIKWPNIAAACQERTDEFGDTYYPSIVFGLEKELENGARLVVENNIFISPCDTDGLPGTTNEATWNVPDKIPDAWNQIGGSANKGVKKFFMTANFITPQQHTLTGESFSFSSVLCDFEEVEGPPAPTIPTCTNGCSGPGAVCNRGTCTCSRGHQYVPGKTNECRLIPVVKEPDVDCVLGAAYDHTSCSNPCGQGTKKVRQRIVTPSSGNGAACPAANCFGSFLCVEKTVQCDGKATNPNREACEAVTTAQEGCLFCKCRNQPPLATCDSNLECRTSGVVQDNGQNDGFCYMKQTGQSNKGCEGCDCNVGAAVLCDGDLECKAGKCEKQKTGCGYCPCGAGDSCDGDLKCGPAKLCVAESQVVAPSDTCFEGTERCPCTSAGTCNSGILECAGNVCRVMQAGQVVRTQPRAPAPDVDAGVDLGVIIGASVAGCCCLIIVIALVIFLVVMLSRKKGGGPGYNNAYQQSARHDTMMNSARDVAMTQSSIDVENSVYPSQQDTLGGAYPSQTGSVGGAYPSQQGSTGGAYPSQQGGDSSDAFGSYGQSQYPTAMTSPAPYAEGGANPGGAFVCSVCSKSYPSEADLQHHVDKRH